ncbi:MAG: septum site-determining protein MinC [Aeromonadaceae bacterium]
MAERGIELKGTTFTLSVLHLTDTDPKQIKELLEEKVAQAPQFFNCAPLVVNVEKLDETPDFEALKETIEREDFVLVGITGAKDEATKVAAKAAGLAVMTAGKRIEQVEPAPQPQPVEEVSMSSTRVHHGNVRSGQQIYASGGSLVILGSVSNGAEVIADDSIHIYGTLRGRALAGARGNSQARIYCQQLEPELISIAGTYQLSDALAADVVHKDVHIRLEQDKLIFERLQS